MIGRDLLEQEISAIFVKQQKLNNEFASDELLKEYWQIASYVRGAQSVEHMIGVCKYSNEQRAPKNAFSVEQFILASKVANIRLSTGRDEDKTLADFAGSFESAFNAVLQLAKETKSGVTLAKLRKKFNIDDWFAFKGHNYADDQGEKKVFAKLDGYHIFKEALGDQLTELETHIELFDEVARILSIEKNDEAKIAALQKAFKNSPFNEQIANAYIDKLLPIAFDRFIELSLSVVKTITPTIITTGKDTKTAIEEAGYKLAEPTKQKFLPPIEMDLKNPVVMRAFSQYRKVINAIIRKHGSFDMVHIELAREINSKADRKEIETAQYRNKQANDEAKAFCIAENQEPSGKNIIKAKLWKEQNERCVYSGQAIPRAKLFDEGFVEVDHILPRSRSFDNSTSNKVLVFSGQNQDKSARTPYEWIFDPDGAQNQETWDEFEARVNTFKNFSKAKRGKLLKENFADEQSQKKFVERNLNDTRYMSKLIKNFTEDHLLFAGKEKLPVRVRNGKLTADLRRLWGLPNKDRDTDGDTHHARDAIVLALATESIAQDIAKYYRDREDRKEQYQAQLPNPLGDTTESFRQIVASALEPLKKPDLSRDLKGQQIVSRATRKDATGATHLATIKSPKTVSKGVAINKGRGICDNGEMVRVDVFTNGKHFFYVPIYVADMIKRELPNKAIATGKEKRIEMDDRYKFIFSLHKDELIRLVKGNKNQQTDILGYFVSVHSKNGSVTLRSIDGTACYTNSKGIKTDTIELGGKSLDAIEKYQVDPLGIISKVSGEKRLPTIAQTRAIKARQKRHR
ncbi:CRISPR-associated endonuclease Cas9 [Campylobacterota bacterium]|nr:CRISPR-associated endonuclease Cas9 [Campylobacterota bacterium]